MHERRLTAETKMSRIRRGREFLQFVDHSESLLRTKTGVGWNVYEYNFF
jgi:hypothetical protein